MGLKVHLVSDYLVKIDFTHNTFQLLKAKWSHITYETHFFSPTLDIHLHCVKSVLVRIYSGPYILAFGLLRISPYLVRIRENADQNNF